MTKFVIRFGQYGFCSLLLLFHINWDIFDRRYLLSFFYQLFIYIFLDQLVGPKFIRKFIERDVSLLAVPRERARRGMCNLREQRCVKELPKQRKTRLVVDRENEKRGCVEESLEQRVTRLNKNMISVELPYEIERIPLRGTGLNPCNPT